MLGIILCGGQSTRMGTDKGLLRLEAKTWAQTAIDKMASLGVAVKLSVNTSQFAAYSTVFDEKDLVVDTDLLQLGGPMLGILSCHLQHPDQDLFALACDMPLMEPALLKTLYKRYQEQPGFDAYIFTSNGEPEPLCGIYTAKGLSRIHILYKEGKLVKHSMKFMLDNLRVDAVNLSEDQQQCFRNFNAHAELNGL